MRIVLALLVAALGSLGGGAAPTAVVPPDKGSYTLFRPTPTALLREMNPDRPDKTESPFTVDAGHFQLELDFLNYSYDRHNAARDDTRVQAWGVAPLNLKVGLGNSTDLQFIVQHYNRVRTSSNSAGRVTRAADFGDFTTRLKVNLWGNDGGPTALGLMPYVKWPTARGQLGNGSVEGGLILPMAVELPYGWDAGGMAQFDLVRDATGPRYHLEFVQSVTFGHRIVGKLAGYVEFYSSFSAERGAAWVATADVGLTYSLTANLKIDAGVNFGVTRAADDLALFTGLSWRF